MHDFEAMQIEVDNDYYVTVLYYKINDLFFSVKYKAIKSNLFCRNFQVIFGYNYHHFTVSAHRC